MRSAALLGGVLWAVLGAPRAASADWQVAAYLGAATTSAPSLRLTQADSRTDVSLTGLTWRGESFESPQYYSARVTWFHRRESPIGVEAEFTHLKAFLNTGREAAFSGTVDGQPIARSARIDTVVQRLAMSHGLNLLLANVVTRVPIVKHGGTARVWLTGRFGAGPTIPHVESTIASQSDDHYEWSRPAVHAGGGIAVAFASHWLALADYRWTRTTAHVTVADGRVESTLHSQHVTFGVGWRFK